MCYNIIQLSADDVILYTEEYLYSAHIQATPVRLLLYEEMFDIMHFIIYINRLIATKCGVRYVQLLISGLCYNSVHNCTITWSTLKHG